MLVNSQDNPVRHLYRSAVNNRASPIDFPMVRWIWKWNEARTSTGENIMEFLISQHTDYSLSWQTYMVPIIPIRQKMTALSLLFTISCPASWWTFRTTTTKKWIIYSTQICCKFLNSTLPCHLMTSKWLLPRCGRPVFSMRNTWFNGRSLISSIRSDRRFSKPPSNTRL